MSENRNLPIMLFILGLFLIATGIALALYTTTETHYLNYYGINVPQQRTVQPYVGGGIVLACLGTLVLVGAFVANQSKKSVTVTMEMPKTEQVKINKS
jgi:hypothetical protein